MPDQMNCYRFALLGTSSSGKTCILAQLGRNKDSLIYRGIDSNTATNEALRYSSVLLSHSSGEPGQNKTKGYDWLYEAMNRIINRQLPEGTPSNLIVKDFKFNMRRSDYGEFTILMSEYAGELIRTNFDSNLETNTDSNPEANADPIPDKPGLSDELKAFLKTCDGLLVLLECYRENNGPTEMEWDYLKNLQQFFTSLKLEKPEYPVAILFTKWDRVSKNFERENFRLREEDKLGQYVQSKTYYNGILGLINDHQETLPIPEVDTVRQKNQLQRYQESQKLDHIKMFPVSALGSELPSPDAESFCLVEPFVWLAQCCDDIEIRHLHEAWRQTKRFWYILWPFSRKRQEAKERMKDYVQKLEKRHPRGNKREEKEFQQKLRKYKRPLLFRSLLSGMMSLFYLVICVAALALAADGARYGFNIWQIKDMKQKLASEPVLPDVLIQVRNQVRNQGNSWPLKIPTLFALPDSEYHDIACQTEEKLTQYYQEKLDKAEGAERKKIAQEIIVAIPGTPLATTADKIYQTIIRKEEDELWKKVQTAPSPEQQLMAIKTYRSVFPTGFYAASAKEMESQLVYKNQEAAFNAIVVEKDEHIQKNKIDLFLKEYPNGGSFAKRLNDIRLDIEKKKEDDFWYMVDQEKTEEKKLTTINKYLELYPQGRYLTDAAKLKNDLEAKRIKHEQEDLKNIALEKNPTVRKEHAEDFIKRNSNPNLLSKAREMIAAADLEIRWNKETMNFERDKSRLDIKGIFSSLVLLAEFDQKKAEKYVREFQSLVGAQLAAVDETKMKLEMLSEAKNFIPTLKEKLNELDTVFLTEASDAFSLRQKNLLEQFDQELYSKVLANKDVSSCNTYLKEMERYKSGKHQVRVKEYLDYLASMKMPKDRRVSVVLNWGSASVLNKNVKINLLIANKMVCEEKLQIPTSFNRIFTIKDVKLDDRVNFEIRVFTDDNWTIRDGHNYGTGRQEFILRDLKKGERLTMTGEKNENYGLSLTITLKEMEPDLPPLD